MKISVVILNWNRAEDTIKAVKSVLAQNYPAKEALVWDNASTDQSREVLEEAFADEPEVMLHWADANYGVAEGRNRAFRASSGDVILSLDSDAWFEGNDALSKLADVFHQEENVGAVSFEVVRPDGHLMWAFSRPADTWRKKTFDTMRVDGCSFAVQRKVFESYKAFPPHYSPYGAEDQHLAFWLVGQNLRVIYLPSITVVHAFDDKGRNNLQFAMHVRNSLWLTMELFPFPETIVSSLRKAWWLYQDAREQKRFRHYAKGIADALWSYRPAHRRALSREGFIRLRALMKEDQRLAQQAAPAR